MPAAPPRVTSQWTFLRWGPPYLPSLPHPWPSTVARHLRPECRLSEQKRHPRGRAPPPMTSWARARPPAGRLCSVPAAPTFPSNIHHRLHRGNRKHPTKPTTTTTTTSTTTPLSVARVPLSSSVSSVVRSLPDDGGIVGCMQQQQPQPPSCRRRRPCSPAVPVTVPGPCVHSPERRTGTGTGGGRPQLREYVV